MNSVALVRISYKCINSEKEEINVHNIYLFASHLQHQVGLAKKKKERKKIEKKKKKIHFLLTVRVKESIGVPVFWDKNFTPQVSPGD